MPAEWGEATKCKYSSLFQEFFQISDKDKGILDLFVVANELKLA